jgi:hypothetical protein
VPAPTCGARAGGESPAADETIPAAEGAAGDVPWEPTMPSQPQMSGGAHSQNHFQAFAKVGTTALSIMNQPGGSVLQMALTEPGVATSEPAFSRKEVLKKAKLKTTSVWYKKGKATRMEAPPAGKKGWEREGNLRVITVADRQKLLRPGETLHRHWYARYGARKTRIGAFLRRCATLLNTERGRAGSNVYCIARRCALSDRGGGYLCVPLLTPHT